MQRATLVQKRTLTVLVITQIVGTVGVGVAPSIGALLAGEVTDNEAWAGLARTASTLGAALLGLPLGNLPSGVFTANSAWLVLAVIAFNLTRTAGLIADRAGRLARATTATIRHTLIHVPARLARSARRVTLHLPEAWPWQNAFTRLFAQTHHHRHQPTTAAPAARPRIHVDDRDATPGPRRCPRHVTTRRSHSPGPPKVHQ